MTYELAKELKDAGFPFDLWHENDNGPRYWEAPTLSELIEACETVDDRGFNMLRHFASEWQATQWSCDETGRGSTPEEAVARLWLALQKAKVE